jgi:acyl-CoA thioester hydrolase
MKFELPAGLLQVHEMRIPVRWGDLDAIGHVNNTVYFRYFETLRIDWFRGIGVELTSTGVGPVMANGFCNFRRQIEYPGELVARHFVAAPGRASLDTFFTLATADAPDLICADGGATLVWLDFDSRRTVPVPDAVRQACTPAPGLSP